ncbi:putative restriction endonuclease domain-containing protein [Gammaproteobacteria bacterium]
MMPHKITPEEYHRMGPIFLDARLELIRGELFNMAPIGISHFWTVTQLDRWLNRRLADRALVVCQGPLALPDSEPQPDLMVLRLEDYRRRLPEPADVLWLIEVADTSISHDRTRKLPLYARHGIPEVWLIDLNTRVAEVHRQPDGEVYRLVTRPNPLSPQDFPDLILPLEEILP